MFFFCSFCAFLCFNKNSNLFSNSNEILNVIPTEDRDPSLTLDFNNGNTVKTLGIQWNTIDDCFSFKINLGNHKTVSKRTILSEAASLYDPLGWLTPSTVIAKSLFKSLWENGLDWDTPVPNFIKSKWLKYRNSPPILSSTKIPRWLQSTTNSKIQLHCFCDASTVAYAAVVYSRTEYANDVFVNLLQAKSKVSPIKLVTIPHLELCAAALLVRLTEKVKKSLDAIDSICYWSDSSTVLSWIQKSPAHWNVYVGNRVAEIQRFRNPLDWRYVPSGLNPADCASRGVLPHVLVQNDTWWKGPQFLYSPSENWPNNLVNLSTTEEQKKTNVFANVSTVKEYPLILSTFSKLQVLLRFSAYLIRYLKLCRNPDKKCLALLHIRKYLIH